MITYVRNWAKLPQAQVFMATWLAYAGFYFCRKNFSVAMPLLGDDLHMSKYQMANIIAVFSFVYMAGQFINGYLADKLGSKKIVTLGLLLAIGANLLMGFAGGAVLFMGLMIINGYGQSTGWSGLVKMMSDWYAKDVRGIVMSWWTTCYVVGGFLAVIFATWWATNPSIFPQLTWKRVFWAPALLLTCILFFFIRFSKDGKKDTSETARKEQKLFSFSINNVGLKDTITNPAILVTSLMYFGLKFIRYTFLFWLPLYLTQAFGYSNKVAGYTSSVFEAAGFIGVLLSGYISDKLYHSRRFPVGAIFMFGLAAVFILQPFLAGIGYWGNVTAVAMIGLFTYGPDALMSGAAAQDLGRENAGTAAGFINGVGSLGQIISPYAVAFISEKFGWQVLFEIFIGVSVISAILLCTQWNFGIKSNEEKALENIEVIPVRTNEMSVMP